MALIVFVTFAAIGQLLNVLLCLALDKIFSPTVGALSFVVLYMLVFAGAWMLTLRVVDREAQQDHTSSRTVTS
jgi:hypothetical protein